VPKDEREDTIRRERKGHYDTQASLRKALHLYRNLDLQLDALERLKRYMADETSSYRRIR